MLAQVKRLSLILGLVAVFATSLAFPLAAIRAQSSDEHEPESRPNIDGTMLLGPSAGAAQLYNVGSLAIGSKTSPKVAYSYGGQFAYVVTDGLSLELGAVYDTRSLYISDSLGSLGTMQTTTTFNYLSLRPSISFGGLMLGLGIGVPLGSTGQVSSAITQNVTGSAGDMNLLIEARIGLAIPVMESDLGTLRLSLEGSYALTHIRSSTGSPYGTSVNNGPFAGIGVGVSYLFKLPI